MTCKFAGNGRVRKWAFSRLEPFTCDFLHGNSPIYATGTSVRAVIVGWFKCRGFTAEDGVQETAGFPGLGNSLTDRKSLGMFLQECRLTDVK